LVTNSIKHAFKGVEYPEILIFLRTHGEKRIDLIVQDNGSKEPSQNHSQGFGLDFVSKLVKGLNGSYNEKITDQGWRTEINIELKE